MHIYIPPTARTDLRAFTQYVNQLSSTTIFRLRTFRLLFGLKSHIVPLSQLRFLPPFQTSGIPAFEKNLEWVNGGIRSRELWGRKAWYVQPGLGGQEMDMFWRRVGMGEGEVREVRERAVRKMREVGRGKVRGMKEAVEKYQGGGTKKGEQEKKAKVTKITLK